MTAASLRPQPALRALTSSANLFHPLSVTGNRNVVNYDSQHNTIYGDRNRLQRNASSNTLFGTGNSVQARAALRRSLSVGAPLCMLGRRLHARRASALDIS